MAQLRHSRQQLPGGTANLGGARPAANAGMLARLGQVQEIAATRHDEGAAQPRRRKVEKGSHKKD
ncbi:MAG: hypothetical protein HYY96_10880 [Candidatus Tectomicrobia bacterium]|nr:hypothetical protein [Candidatus Tectomicrobia bacterium]